MAPSEQLGKYTLLERIGVGGMAEVWLARASGPGGFAKGCVVKMVRPGVDQDRFSRMFMDEARLAALLNHPHIVQIFDFGEVGGRLYIAMEFIQGRTLRALLKKLDQRNLRLPLDHACRIMAGVLAGLEHAHTARDQNGDPLRCIHRDVSPENVMVGYTGIPKLVDFGIAKATLSTDRTRDGRAKGKLTYMAPEQLLGAPLDHRVDIHACGVMLYELCTGKHPFPISQPEALARAIVDDPPPHPQTLDPGLPDELCEIIMKALDKDPERRFSSANEMLAEMENFGQTLTVSTTAQKLESFIQFIFAEEMAQDADRARRASGPATTMARDRDATLAAAPAPPPAAQAPAPTPPQAAPSPSADLMLSDERDTVKEDPRQAASARVPSGVSAPPGQPGTRPRGPQVVVPVGDRARANVSPDAPTALKHVGSEAPVDLGPMLAPPLPTGENVLDTRERNVLDNVFTGPSARPVRLDPEATPTRLPLPQGAVSGGAAAPGALPRPDAAREWETQTGTGLTGPVLRGKLWYVPRRVALTALAVAASASAAVVGSLAWVGGVQSGRASVASRPGTLSVVADPECTVAVNGNALGRAPVTRAELASGTHELVTECAGTRTRTSVQVSPAQEVVVVMPRLEKRAGPRRGGTESTPTSTAR